LRAYHDPTAHDVPHVGLQVWVPIREVRGESDEELLQVDQRLTEIEQDERLS
jgi:hypothetical protein